MAARTSLDTYIIPRIVSSLSKTMSVNTTYKQILVPTDGSKGIESTVEHALELAHRFDAQLHILYIVDTDAVAYGLGVAHLDRLEAGRFEGMGEVTERAQTAVDAVANQAEDRGINAITVIGAGKPAQIIATYTEDHPIDLIVMGSHGRSGVRRILLGSITERVARMVRVPVLVADRRAEHESHTTEEQEVVNNDPPILQSPP